MKDMYKNLVKGTEKISVIGMGYVGMPIAVAFAQKLKVIGFDINKNKIEKYIKGIDPTGEIGKKQLLKSCVNFTSNPDKLKEASFHIIAVPTPVNEDKTPDLSLVESASAMLGRNLRKNSIVVYESTVYPGVTEEICKPILENESGLKAGKDFKIGYSPERINPGDKMHRFENIIKIVSGMDKQTLEIISKVYELVVKAGVYKAESIKVAEAAKIIENSQRDINVAFMNELSHIFNIMEIDTKAVLNAAGTKWNFLKFTPGLVGGHCIGVDPYYLTHRAEQFGYHSKIILAGRQINDSMGKYIAENTVKNLLKAKIPPKNAKVLVLGLTFKENCPDIRNTKVVDIISELKQYGIKPVVCDPVADKNEAKKIYGITLVKLKGVRNIDALILAVAHDAFKGINLKKFFGRRGKKILVDVKSMINRKDYPEGKFIYWSL